MNRRPQILIPGSWHCRAAGDPEHYDNVAEIWEGKESVSLLDDEKHRGTKVFKVVPYVHRLAPKTAIVERITTRPDP